jgi:cytochrome c oxidase subunit IV
MSETTEQTPAAAGTTVLTGSLDPAAVPAIPEAQQHHLEAEGATHGAHPTDAKYVKIALILAAITGVEVTISYAKGLGDAGPPLLLALAAIKFFMVGAYFMHLRFDNRVLRRLFITGIVLACTIYMIVFLLLGVFSSTHGAHH